MQILLTVSPDSAGNRLDIFLKENAGDDLSRSTVQKWIESGFVRDATTGNTRTKSSYKVEVGDSFQIQIEPRSPSRLLPMPMDIPIVYEEEEFLVIHKKPGVACHGGPGDDQPTLVNGLLYQFQNLSNMGGSARPGIVHRLDKPTEGLLVVAKTDRAHGQLAKLFQDRDVEKSYKAWVLQAPVSAEGTLDAPIGRHPVDRIKMTVREDGRRAITHYKTESIVQTQTGRKYSFLSLQIETGRTHQIRVHLSKVGCPVVGDSLYSRSAKEYAQFGLLLFAEKLRFPHPFRPQEILEFSLPLPDRFHTFARKCSSY